MLKWQLKLVRESRGAKEPKPRRESAVEQDHRQIRKTNYQENAGHLGKATWRVREMKVKRGRKLPRNSRLVKGNKASKQ